MKKQIFLFVLLLIISLNSYAQITSVQFNDFPKMELDTMSIDFFKKKKLILHPFWETRYAPKKMVIEQISSFSTDTIYETLEFDKEGRLISVEQPICDKREKHTIYKLAYNTNSDITEYQKYENSALVIDLKIAYNNQGYIIRETFKDTDLTIIYNFERDEKGRILENKSTLSRSHQAPKTGLRKYTYDDDKLLQIEKSNYSTGKEQKVEYISYYKYDENGNLIEQFDIYPSENNKKILRSTHQYDEQGNEIAFCVYSSEDVRTEYTLDKNGNIITKKDCKDDDCSYLFTYSYDEHNNLIKESTKNQLKDESAAITEYTYDNRNNKIKEITSVNGKIIEARSITYNQFDMKIKRTFDHSRLSSKVWENKYEFDKRENWTQVEYFSNGYNPTQNVKSSLQVNRTITYWEDNQNEKPQYDLKETYIPYRKGKLWGLADTLGKIVVTPQYDTVIYSHGFEQGFFIVEKNNLKSIITANGEVFPFKYPYLDFHGINIKFSDSRNKIHFVINDIGILPVTSEEPMIDNEISITYHEADENAKNKKDNEQKMYKKENINSDFKSYYHDFKNLNKPQKRRYKTIKIKAPKRYKKASVKRYIDYQEKDDTIIRKWAYKAYGEEHLTFFLNSDTLKYIIRDWKKGSNNYSTHFHQIRNTYYHVSNYLLTQQLNKKGKIQKYGFITHLATVKPQFETVEAFLSDRYYNQPFFVVSKKVKRKTLYGIMLADGTWQLPLQSDFAITDQYFKKFEAIVIRKNKKLGLMNLDFNIIIPPKYEKIEHFSPVSSVTTFVKGKYGIYNLYNEYIVAQPVFKDKPFYFKTFANNYKAIYMLDANNKFTGYALPNGTLLYED